MTGSTARTGVSMAGVGVTRLEALRYRSLHYVSQSLGSFNVLVGPNASGKSNFLDVLAFLGDVLRAGLSTAVLGDDRWNITMRAADGSDLLWSPLAGSSRVGCPPLGGVSSAAAARIPERPSSRSGWSSFELAVEVAVPDRLLGRDPAGCRVCRYEVGVDVARGEPEFTAEAVWLLPAGRSAASPRAARRAFPQSDEPPERLVSPSCRQTDGWHRVVFRDGGAGTVIFQDEASDWSVPFRIDSQQSALANLPADGDRFPVALWLRRTLQDTRRVSLSGEALRRPCPPMRQGRYRADGSNLPHLVHKLEHSDPRRHRLWVEHIREALPEVVGVTTRERPEDRHRYLVVRHPDGHRTPSWLLSEGTLRLFALTLLAYLPDTAGVHLIEEPENGLHPLAVETVLQSLSSVYDAQILLTTHSPLVARMVEPEHLLCLTRDDVKGTGMTTGSEHPNLRDRRGSADLGTLLASGVLG